MDSLETLAFARSLIDIDSTTGREAEAGHWLAARLAALGYNVLEQKIARGCANILATIDDPVVVFSTHFDCVPPFFPSRVENGRLIGRGACDAKGILAAQVAAAERLRASGERRVGLLFVVGEERGSDGAVAANTIPNQCRFIINGEPTDSRLATATRGNLRVRLEARGRAAHSAAPEQGESAIDKLVDALVELRALPLPVDPDLGSTFYSIGLIEGGVAPNVIPAHASAEVMFRTIGSADDILAVLGALKPRVQISEVLRVRPIRMHTVTGFETHVFQFTVGGMRPCSALALEMISMTAAGIRGLATRDWTMVDDLAHHSKAPALRTKAEILRRWDEVTDEINTLWPRIAPHRFEEIDVAFGQYEGRVFGLFLYWIDNEIHHRGQAYVYLRALGIEPPPFYER